jgi:hypothetical protein
VFAFSHVVDGVVVAKTFKGLSRLDCALGVKKVDGVPRHRLFLLHFRFKSCRIVLLIRVNGHDDVQRRLMVIK